MTLVRYSLLRMLILFICLLTLWLAGVREPTWLMVGTAISSVTVSFFALRGPREELARQVAQRVAGRLPSAEEPHSDEDIEDAAVADSNDDYPTKGGPDTQSQSAAATSNEPAAGSEPEPSAANKPEPSAQGKPEPQQ